MPEPHIELNSMNKSTQLISSGIALVHSFFIYSLGDVDPHVQSEFDLLEKSREVNC